MKQMREWGYDVYCSEQNIDYITALCKRYTLYIYDVYWQEGILYFSARISHRLAFRRYATGCKRVRTSGFFGFVQVQLKKPRRIAAIIASALTMYVCTNTVFLLEVAQGSQVIESQLQNYLQEQGMQAPMQRLSKRTFLAMEQELKETFFDRIEWLNLRSVGSAYFLAYAPRLKKAPVPLSDTPLVAYKQGIIAYFELKRGIKLVKEHDLVKVGDVLVTKNLLDSRNQPEATYVEGKVYAYTQLQAEAEMKENMFSTQNKAFAFFQLLFSCRNQVAKELQKDERIINENILHFDQKGGIITMKIHYTLYEDITHP